MILFRLTPLWMVAKCMYILFGSRSCSSCNRKEKKNNLLKPLSSIRFSFRVLWTFVYSRDFRLPLTFSIDFILFFLQ